MLDDPVEQGLFETNVVARFFALNPFVPQDFFALGKELLVEQRFPNEFARVVCRSSHVLQ